MNVKDLMKFEDFADAVRASGAINRWPRLGNDQEVVTYSVYLNGPVASKLPLQYQEHEFKDIMLHALTEKLWLNPTSLRDNLKVAELVSIRGAWMSTVLETSQSRSPTGEIIPLSDDIIRDYELLSAGLTHPWILNEINQQQQMSLGLRPAIEQAEVVHGSPISDRTPDVVSVGKILAQNKDFTVQATHAGEVVTHENRRLMNLPAVGQDVMVSYYRGQGQVINRKELTISEPYIDDDTNDLAVNLTNADGIVKEKILFNSINSIAKFQEAEGLDKSFVAQAMDVRAATPKIIEPIEAHNRNVVSDVYIDETSRCIAVNYVENNNQYTALFGSADAMAEHGASMGIKETHIKQAYSLEKEKNLSKDRNGQRSLLDAHDFVDYVGLKAISANLEKSSYIGTVVGETTHHIIQNIGQHTAVIHDKRILDKLPAVGDKLSVKYESYRAKVDISQRAQGHGAER